MGLENSNSATFLTIGNGKIVRQVMAPTATSVERTNKNNKVVHEESYDKITGIITGITTREHEEYGKFWDITLTDGGDTYKLQFKYSSGYASAFLKALPNADLSKPLTIIPKMTVEGDKKKTTLFLNQGGTALKWAYTKDNPNGLPQMVQVKVKGQLQWDDSDMMEFLENMVKNDIQPQLKANQPATTHTEAAPELEHEHASEEGDKKMPF